MLNEKIAIWVWEKILNESGGIQVITTGNVMMKLDILGPFLKHFAKINSLNVV